MTIIANIHLDACYVLWSHNFHSMGDVEGVTWDTEYTDAHPQNIAFAR